MLEAFLVHVEGRLLVSGPNFMPSKAEASKLRARVQELWVFRKKRGCKLQASEVTLELMSEELREGVAITRSTWKSLAAESAAGGPAGSPGIRARMHPTGRSMRSAVLQAILTVLGPRGNESLRNMESVEMDKFVLRLRPKGGSQFLHFWVLTFSQQAPHSFKSAWRKIGAYLAVPEQHAAE